MQTNKKLPMTLEEKLKVIKSQDIINSNDFKFFPQFDLINSIRIFSKHPSWNITALKPISFKFDKVWNGKLSILDYDNWQDNISRISKEFLFNHGFS